MKPRSHADTAGTGTWPVAMVCRHCSALVSPMNAVSHASIVVVRSMRAVRAISRHARSLSRPHLKFSCASFHPAHSNSVLVGGYQSVWHWDWGHDAIVSAPGNALRSQWRAHDGVVSAMACSVRADQLATVSHDTRVKLWKVS